MKYVRNFMLLLPAVLLTGCMKETIVAPDDTSYTQEKSYNEIKAESIPQVIHNTFWVETGKGVFQILSTDGELSKEKYKDIYKGTEGWYAIKENEEEEKVFDLDKEEEETSNQTEEQKDWLVYDEDQKRVVIMKSMVDFEDFDITSMQKEGFYKVYNKDFDEDRIYIIDTKRQQVTGPYKEGEATKEEILGTTGYLTGIVVIKDSSGSYVVNGKTYTNAKPIDKDTALAKEGNRIYLVTKEGETELPEETESASGIANNKVMLLRKGNWSIYDIGSSED